MAVTMNTIIPPAPVEPIPDVMTRKQLMKYLQIADSIYYAIMKGDHPFPSHDVPGGQRFLKAEIDEWVKSHPQPKLGPPVGKKAAPKVAASDEQAAQP